VSWLKQWPGWRNSSQHKCVCPRRKCDLWQSLQQSPPRFVGALLGNFGSKGRRKCQSKFATQKSSRSTLWLRSKRGYSVKDVVDWLGISTKSLYTWIAQFSKPQRQTDQEVEIRRRKKELARVTEERDILKNRSGPLPACVQYKQLVLHSSRRTDADSLLVGQTPLKNVVHGLMRT
jgi:transposase